MEVINLFIDEIIKAYLRLQIVQAKGFPLEGLKRLNQPIKRLRGGLIMLVQVTRIPHDLCWFNRLKNHVIEVTEDIPGYYKIKSSNNIIPKSCCEIINLKENECND